MHEELNELRKELAADIKKIIQMISIQESNILHMMEVGGRAKEYAVVLKELQDKYCPLEVPEREMDQEEAEEVVEKNWEPETFNKDQVKEVARGNWVRCDGCYARTEYEGKHYIYFKRAEIKEIQELPVDEYEYYDKIFRIVAPQRTETVEKTLGQLQDMNYTGMAKVGDGKFRFIEGEFDDYLLYQFQVNGDWTIEQLLPPDIKEVE